MAVKNKKLREEIRERKRGIKEEIKNKIEEERKKGNKCINLTVKEMANKYLISPITIYRWCRKEGQEERKKKPDDAVWSRIERSEEERRKYYFGLRGSVSGKIDGFIKRFNRKFEVAMFYKIMSERIGETGLMEKVEEGFKNLLGGGKIDGEK